MPEPITSTSRAAIAHYREQAAAAYIAAAKDRARAHHLPDTERLDLARMADTRERDGDRWTQLADELEAFASDQGEAEHPDQGALL